MKSASNSASAKDDNASATLNMATKNGCALIIMLHRQKLSRGELIM